MTRLLLDPNGNPLPYIRPGATVKISPSGSSAATAAVIHATEECLVRIAVSAAMTLNFAASPTATTTDLFMPANTVDYFVIPAGYKIAALGTGDVYITLQS